VAEVSTAGRAVARAIAARVAGDGGAALIVDYGHDRPGPGDTLQAVRRHRPVAPFADPGEADLSAHVCFASLAAEATDAGARVHGPVAQGAFLEALGIRQRADALSRGAPDKAAAIAAAQARLIGPEAMGTLFRVLAFGPPGVAPLAGL
jgi:SAM-dependent MidA family methyltransferase